MPPRGKCGTCEKTIGEKAIFFKCTTCDFQSHIKCDERFYYVKDRIADVTYQSFEMMGYRWFCLKCIHNVPDAIENVSTPPKSDESKIVNEIKNLCERVGNIEKLLSPGAATSSYASVTKCEPERSLVVTHSNKNISSKKIAQIVTKSFDPVFAKVSELRVLRDKCVIKTNLDEENLATFAQKLTGCLGNGSEARPMKERKPRIKIVGNMHIESDLMNENNLKNFIKRQNAFIQDDFEIKFVKKAEAKSERPDQIIIETTPRAYKAILKVGHLLVAFTKCKVYDANTVPRCFKCSSLGHFEKNCSSTTVCCPKCMGKHRLKECKSNVLKCVNCVTSNQESKRRDDVSHAAFDRNCPTLARRTSVLRSFFENENG